MKVLQGCVSHVAGKVVIVYVLVLISGWFGVVVTDVVTSTKLSYVEPG